jgi:hypothetical protein
MRKALGWLKKNRADLIVAEFNYQHAFRDRLSSLESLIAVVERDPAVRVVVIYESEFSEKLDVLKQQYSFFAELPFPIEELAVRGILDGV